MGENKKIIVYIAMSLDGYIADPTGGVGWLSGDGSDNENMGSFPSFYKTIDTIILGYKTYNQIVTELSPHNWVYEDKKTYVLTHKQVQNTNNILFTSEDALSLAKKLKKSSENNIWLCGGSKTINDFHKLQLIDEYIVTIIPIILGSGIRLFSQHDFSQSLCLISTRSYNGMVDLKYKKPSK